MPLGVLSRPLILRIAVSSFQGVIEANDLCLKCGDARGDTPPTIQDHVIRLHVMPKALASMEKTPV